MGTGVGAKIGLDGLGGFKKDMQYSIQAAKTLAAEMKAVAAQFGSSGNSIGALSAKNDVLSRSLELANGKLSLVGAEIQKEEAKLQDLAAALDKANTEFGEGSAEAAKASTEYSNQAITVEKLKTQYNNAQADVNKFSRELEDNQANLNKNNRTLDESERSLDGLARALDESGAAAQDAGRGYDDAESSADSFGNAADRASEISVKSAAVMGAAFATAQKLISSAVNAVKSAVGDAVSRYDTLNQFPKIMQRMGYSADEAEASVKKLSDGVQGLPTTLDDIVASTKQFEVATGTLGKATDTAISMNNAFIASGSSAADASRGMEQYRQMLANGTVDAQSWKSVNESMTYAMQEVANSFGYASTVVGGDFYSAIKRGEVTMSEVNARIIELNDGVGGFAEVAQTASGGIATAWDNMKLKVVQGIEGMLTSIQGMLSDSRLPSIEEMLQTIGVKIKDAFSAAGKVIAPIVPLVANIVNTIIDHGDIVIGVIAGIAAGFAGWKIGSIVSAIVTSMQSLTAGLGGAATAQRGLNTAMSANPIGLIISLIAMLVTGIVYLWNTNEDFRNSVIAIWEGIKSVVSTVVDALVTFFTVTLPNAFKAVIQWFKDIPATLVEFFSTLPERIGFFLGEVLAFFANLGADLVNWVRTEVPKIIDNIINFFKELPGKIWDWLKETVVKVVQWGTDMRNKAKDAASGLVRNVVDTIKNLPQRMLELGKNIVKGIWDGINNMVGWIKDKISGFANSVLAGFQKAFKTHSPSRLFEDEIGENLALGIGVGFIGAMPGVIKDMLRSAGGLTNTIAQVIPEMQGLEVASRIEPMSKSGGAGTTVSPVFHITIHADGADSSTVSALKDTSMQLAEEISEKIEFLTARKLRAQGVAGW